MLRRLTPILFFVYSVFFFAILGREHLSCLVFFLFLICVSPTFLIVCFPSKARCVRRLAFLAHCGFFLAFFFFSPLLFASKGSVQECRWYFRAPEISSGDFRGFFSQGILGREHCICFLWSCFFPFFVRVSSSKAHCIRRLAFIAHCVFFFFRAVSPAFRFFRTIHKVQFPRFSQHYGIWNIKAIFIFHSWERR